MKILVTGSAGFIGFHLVRRLLAAGNEVVGVDNLNPYYDVGLKYGRLSELGVRKEAAEAYGRAADTGCAFRFYRLDIEDRPALERLFAGERFDWVCHLAAQAGVRYSLENPQSYISANIQGFFNLLECCRRCGVSRFLFASSSSVYGKNTRIPYREDDRTDAPVSLYAATKKCGELLAYSYAELYGFSVTGLRFFTVYGPWGRPDMAPFLFTRALLEGKPIRVFNRGEMYRDFTYIDDIVEGICRVMQVLPASRPETETPFRIYNMGHAAPVKLSDFIALLERLTGKKACCDYASMQPGDVQATWADVSRLKRDCGYAPATPLETGLTEFIQWYNRFYPQN